MSAKRLAHPRHRKRWGVLGQPARGVCFRRAGGWTLGSGALTAWQEDSLLVGAAQGQCLLCRAGCLWDKGGPGFRGWGLCPSSGNLCLEEP